MARRPKKKPKKAKRQKPGKPKKAKTKKAKPHKKQTKRAVKPVKHLPSFPSDHRHKAEIPETPILPTGWPETKQVQAGDVYLAPSRDIVQTACEIDGNVGQFLAGGMHGQVYSLCRRDKCRYVLKIQLLRSETMILSFFAETYFHSLIQQHGDTLGLELAPRLLQYFTCNTPQIPQLPQKVRDSVLQVGIMVMERYEGSFKDIENELKKPGRGKHAWFTRDKLKEAEDQLMAGATIYSQLHIQHDDIHSGNILFRQKPKFKALLFDWGAAKFVSGANVKQKLLDYYSIEFQKILSKLSRLVA